MRSVLEGSEDCQALQVKQASQRLPLVRYLTDRGRFYVLGFLRSVQRVGFWTACKKALVFLRRSVFHTQKAARPSQPIAAKTPSEPAVPNLQVGDLVEVKSLSEIQQTLDRNGRSKGLFFMAGMEQHCGQQHRVMKRMERIKIESTGETRQVKNMVILAGVLCNNSGCDRSCFYFWREEWLKKVPSPLNFP